MPPADLRDVHRRDHPPSNGAVSVCSIFIASTMATVWPRGDVVALRRRGRAITVPGIGLRTRRRRGRRRRGAGDRAPGSWSLIAQAAPPVPTTRGAVRPTASGVDTPVERDPRQAGRRRRSSTEATRGRAITAGSSMRPLTTGQVERGRRTDRHRRPCPPRRADAGRRRMPPWRHPISAAPRIGRRSRLDAAAATAAAASTASGTRTRRSARRLVARRARCRARPARTSRSASRRRRNADVGGHAEHGVSASACVEAAQRLVAIGTPGDHLGQHRVVVGADDRARRRARSRRARPRPVGSTSRSTSRRSGRKPRDGSSA